jgi:hypothetical protein
MSLGRFTLYFVAVSVCAVSLFSRFGLPAAARSPYAPGWSPADQAKLLPSHLVRQHLSEHLHHESFAPATVVASN